MVVTHFGEIDAFIIHAANHRNRGGLWLRRPVVVSVKDVADSVAIRDYIALEVPCAAKSVLQQEFDSRTPARH